MPTLRHLYLDHNSFQGEVPITMVGIGSGRLETLALDSNQFTGALPEWDPSLSQLGTKIKLHSFHNAVLMTFLR